VIVDADGQVLPTGSDGNIAVQRPDPVMLLQYWNKPAGHRRQVRRQLAADR
jgi:acyl-coenzyme A synthetase/AMP-(fatty) acid ligase